MLLERVKCLHSSFSGKPCFFEFIQSYTPSTNHLASRLCVAVIGCGTRNAFLTFMVSISQQLKSCPTVVASDKPVSLWPFVLYSSAWCHNWLCACGKQRHLHSSACSPAAGAQGACPLTSVMALGETEPNTDLQCLQCLCSQPLTAGRVTQKQALLDRYVPKQNKPLCPSARH